MARNFRKHNTTIDKIFHLKQVFFYFKVMTDVRGVPVFLVSLA